LATILFSGILYAFGCNGGGSVDPPPVTGDYRLEGVLIVDRNSDSTHAAAIATRTFIPCCITLSIFLPYLMYFLGGDFKYRSVNKFSLSPTL